MSASARRPVITLLTDYGVTDEFVGVLHGVIATICPEARVIDLTHGIGRQDIRGGATVLAQSLQYLPVGVHVAVVDPTVGTDRRAIALRLADGRMLVGPDNGLLWPASQAAGGVEQAIEISQSRWRLEPVAATFHGRDVFAPVAAHIAAGERFDQAGAPLDPGLLVRVEEPRARSEAGALLVTVTNSDHFGNVQLGAVSDDISGLAVALGDQLRVLLPSGEACSATHGIAFSAVPEGELILFEDANHRLALGVNHGSALARLCVRAGDQLRISAVREGG